MNPENCMVERGEVIKSYLDGLAKADYTKLLQLFTGGATVSSPLYGEMAAADFFKKLFDDTSESKITLEGIFVQMSDPNIYAAHFIYDWKLRGGEDVSFRCMDIFTFADRSDKISHLTIIYDSSRTRDAFIKLYDE
jgi:hypothetical protein